MALAIMATVFVGFAPSFFLRPLFPEWPSPRESIFYVHGALFALWIVLLVTQTSRPAAPRSTAKSVHTAPDSPWPWSSWERSAR